MNRDIKFEKTVGKIAAGVAVACGKSIVKKKLEDLKLKIISKGEDDLNEGNVAVGDLLCLNDNVGLVVSIDESLRHGKMICLQQSSWNFGFHWCEFLPYLNDSGCEYGFSTDAVSLNDGVENTEKLFAISGSDRDYGFRSAEYCRSIGIGWYLPAIGELYDLFNSPNISKLNEVLSQNGWDMLYPSEGERVYWSSTDSKKNVGTSPKVMIVDTEGRCVTTTKCKSEECNVLPFFRF